MAKTDVKRARAAGLTASRAARFGSRSAAPKRSKGQVVVATLCIAAAGVLTFLAVDTDNDQSSQPDQRDGAEFAATGASENANESASTDGLVPADQLEGVIDAEGAGDEDVAAATADDASTGQVGGVTPGLSALRSLGSPLPPPPSLPGIPTAGEPSAALEVARATPAEPTEPQGEQQNSASTAVVTDFVCPAEAGGEPVTLLLPLLSDTEAPADDALEQAASFGNAANECATVTITVIGYSSAGSNPLEQAVAGLTRAREFVERLNAFNVETEAFEVFAATADQTSAEITDGVEIRVE
ncbi:MAG: hypothetical protein AAF968_08735 [Pseudomonadota bacterium]